MSNLLDLRDLANVALNDRLDIIRIPVLSAAQGFAAQCLGISTGQNRRHQVVSDDWFSGLGFVLKAAAQEAAACCPDLALRKR
ncbi:hypothetical protein ACC728_32940 [Rhizobium ruizarguesonis]|uniref:hypothetical protein n=1 Tax=Rhizobium ruizarguesonis TaxID=2081791 RepID=UPI000462D1E9|nr:hypothetical protein [Rhizobium ruizarguesonis]UED35927.1 hypothetical protein BSO17_35315 [Rhizobium ruizarguesonis]